MLRKFSVAWEEETDEERRFRGFEDRGCCLCSRRNRPGSGRTHPQMCEAVGGVAATVAALLSSSLPTLETTDFLQHREAAGRCAAALHSAPVVMETDRDVALRTGALLDLGEGELQACQGVFSVRVELSLPLLVLRSC